MNNTQELIMFESYAKRLSDIPGVKMVRSQSERGFPVAKFKGESVNALAVELWLHEQGLFLSVEKTDCAYWHTAEYEDLDDHIPMAEAALKGDVAYNLSTFWGIREVCFKVGDTWECTKMDEGQDISFHYITTRKTLRRRINA